MVKVKTKQQAIQTKLFTEEGVVIKNDLDNWGGFWTEAKVDTFIKYLYAYLEIMKGRDFHITYFDGFAGSGHIDPKGDGSQFEGIGLKVLGMNHAKKFDLYYLVDLNKQKIESFDQKARILFPELFIPSQRVFFAHDDCNAKLVRLCNYIREDYKAKRALALIDPFGMQINWESIAQCAGLGIDFWILVPTGLGVNRLLKKDGLIDPKWEAKLVKHLGLPLEEIRATFYKESTSRTLFGEITESIKEENAAEKAAELYVKQLHTVWEYVSDPMPMRNSQHAILYHFIFASNNQIGLKIANDIIAQKL